VKHQPTRFPSSAQTEKISSVALNGLAGCLVVLLLVAALALWLNHEGDRALDRVSHSHDVTLRIQRLLSLAQDAETGQRGYLLTGDEQYLEPFKSSSAEISNSLDTLRAETTDNPGQQVRLVVLEGLIAEKLDELSETIDLRLTDPAAALEIVMTHRGRNTMDRIRRVVRELTDEEERLLADRTSTHAAMTRNATLLLIAIVVLVVTTATVALLQLWREMVRRKRLEDRLRLMLNELDHRVKNNLATVLAVARQTLQNASSLNEFGDLFSGRIHAMARVHEALAVTKWQGAELTKIIEMSLGAYGIGTTDRVAISGDRQLLSARVSSRMGMALHELTTNAAKYGALSGPRGRVEVKWASDPTGRLQILWSEIGGPRVAPPSRTGFGTTIIKDTIEHDLAGQVDMSFLPEGLVCTIDIPRPVEDDARF